jgi:PAS domain S-box-containing protein
MPDYELAIYKKALNEVAHILVTDADGTIIYVNDKVCALTKYSREELIGQNNRIFKSGFHSPEFYENMYNEIKKGKIFKTNFQNKAKDGSLFWMDVTIIPFLDSESKPYKYLTIRFDITDKINEVALKEEFLANVSHDIRTPLHGMMSIIHLLKETSLNEQQLDYIASIQESSDHLEQLVNDLLDIFKIESGKIKFESIPLDFNGILQSLIAIFVLKSQTKDIVYKYKVDENLKTTLYGDSSRLKQILSNLLENATKYTETGSIVIEISLLENLEEKQIVAFKISNTCEGSLKMKQDEVFEKLIQSDAKDSRLFGGISLGLNIVKKLILLQQGTLSLNRNTTEGTIFTFTITYRKQLLAPPTPKIKIEPLVITKQPENYKILIADDDQINRMIFEKQMMKFKYNYTIVESGFEVIDLLQKEPFDLILLDMQMPGMNGDVVLQKIRTEFPEPIRYIPIISVSATVQVKTIQYIIDAGANAHLSKPYKEADLAEIIQKTLPNASVMEKSEKLKEEQNTMLVNLNTLKQFTDEDESFMLELLEYFYSSTPELLDKMEVIYKSNRFELAMLLHKYRSQVSLLGIEELIELTKTMEVALIESVVDYDYDTSFEKIIKISRKVLLEVAIIITKIKSEL